MKVIKCLWCRRTFRWEEDSYRFCDECYSALDGVDLHELEKKLSLQLWFGRETK